MRATCISGLTTLLAAAPAFAQIEIVPREPEERPAPVKVTERAPQPSSRHQIGFSFGQTIAEGSAPFGGGTAFRFFGGTRVFRYASLDFSFSYHDFFARAPGAAAGAILSFGAGLRFELPIVGEWLRFMGRGGAHYSLGLLFFRNPEPPDPRDQTSGPGVVFGGGLRFRLWRDARRGTEMFLGAELSSLWIFQRGRSDSGPTVMNSLALPVSIDW
jgi:hypothetical protein